MEPGTEVLRKWAVVLQFLCKRPQRRTIDRRTIEVPRELVAHSIGLLLGFDGVVVGVEVDEKAREQPVTVRGEESGPVLPTQLVQLHLVCP